MNYIKILILLFFVNIFYFYKKKKPYYYKNKYKEYSIKISKKGVNDTRYIWGFQYVKGDINSLLKDYNIDKSLLKKFDKILSKNIEISELGVGFDKDNEIKKVYFLEEGKNYGYGIKSNGKKTIFSMYERKNTIKNDLKKIVSKKDEEFIFNHLNLNYSVKYYLKSDFVNNDYLTNSIHISLYDNGRYQFVNREFIYPILRQFNLQDLSDSWYEKNKTNLVDYVAITKNNLEEIEVTIYYTKK